MHRILHNTLISGHNVHLLFAGGPMWLFWILQTKVLKFEMLLMTRGEANMLKILPIILFHSAHKLSLLFL